MGDNISCTLFRKSAVTLVYTCCPQNKYILADLMEHRVATASKTYRLVEKELNAVSASNKLAGVLRPHIDQVNITNLDTAPMLPTASNLCSPSPRVVWTAKLLAHLDTCFLLQSEIPIILEYVRDKIKDDALLAEIGVRKVYDKLRTVITRSPPRAEHEDGLDHVDHVDDTSDFEDIPPSIQNKGNGIFSLKEVELLQRSCARMFHGAPIQQQHIKQALECSTSGSDILSKCEMEQLVSCLKYERKQQLRSMLLCNKISASASYDKQTLDNLWLSLNVY